jgi:hypothetical protein
MHPSAVDNCPAHRASLWTADACAPVRQLPTAARRFAFGLTRYRLPNSHSKKFQGTNAEITKKGSQNQPDQKIDNLAVLPGGI